MFDHPAVDCHAHVLSPFVPFPNGPGNKPKVAALRTKEEYYAVLRGHGMTHGLIVQPSAYQMDNSVTLEAMESAPERNIKAIAVVGPDIADQELDLLERRGVVGVRINLVSLDPAFVEKAESVQLVERLRDRGWWLQLHFHARNWPRYEAFVRRHAGKIIVDHFARPDTREGLDEPGFKQLLAFARGGGHAVKLSGANHSSREAFPYRDSNPYVHAVIDAFGIENCVWGSDWPFVNGFDTTNYLQTLEWLSAVVPGAADRKTILWDNPSRLFGFTEHPAL